MRRLKAWLARKLQRFVFRHCPLWVESMLLPESGILDTAHLNAQRIPLHDPGHYQASLTEVTRLGVRQHLFVLRWAYYGSSGFVRPFNQDVSQAPEPAEHWQGVPLVSRKDLPKWSRPLWARMNPPGEGE